MDITGLIRMLFADVLTRNTFAHPTQMTINNATPINSYVKYSYYSGPGMRPRGLPP